MNCLPSRERITSGQAPPVFGEPVDVKVSSLSEQPMCTVCGEPAWVQVTELSRAPITQKLPGAQPRCLWHGQRLSAKS